MRTYLLLVATGLCTVRLHAQPVLTFAAQAPQPGISYDMRYSPFVPPGAAGANQVWDLTALSTDSTRLIQLVAPANTPNGALFAASTVAETGSAAVMYFRSASDGVFNVGSDADGLLIVNSDQGRYLPFPCTYQTSWTDAVAAQFTVDGFDIARSGTITGEADGFGTLILPTGSVGNVLRIHWIQEIVDASAFFDMTTTTDSYLYYAVGQPYPLAQLVSTTITMMGNTITEQYAQWVGGDLSTALPAQRSDVNEADVFPVPAHDRLSFNLPKHFSGTPLITVSDPSGKRVKHLGPMMLSGGNGQLDVSGLAPGIYVLSAIDELGQRATARFVVQ